MLDIIVGERNGYIHYYERTSESPITLTERPDITCNGTTIDVGYNSAPVCVDWDEDGYTDLLTGKQTGEVRLYINDGGDTVPVFSSFSNVQSSGSDIDHYRNCPQVFDLNGDGKKDLLCGANDYNIYYYENTGTNANPAFSGSEVLVSEYAGIRFSLADWNGDGHTDILSSDYNGYVDVHIQQVEGISESAGRVASRTLNAGSNPFAGSVTVQGAGFDEATLSVYDVYGRKLMERPFSGSAAIDGTGLAPGAYIVRVTDAAGSATLRLVRI
jgi:hypothetical protein